ncbi:hypothetical protein [Caproiciproducens galactitolivorans]|uniref:hypothetical protein n=1 Tax=Caproiciproducens galactitolivorans TaxID=642589 RepID=UPI00240A890A|nr:hypothetical protein [Caproiciproducens galactitolivorans]
MYVTAFDWHDFTGLYKYSDSRPSGSCLWNKEKNLIDCVFTDGTEIQFSPSAKSLSKEIQSSLPLQFAFMNSAIYGSTSGEIAFSDRLGTEEFKHMASVLVKCYQQVKFYLRNGELYKIRGGDLLPYARKVYRQLFLSGKLHPCILLLASRAGRITSPDSSLTLFEVHETKYQESDISSDVVEFASFLKKRSEAFDDIISISFYGYSFEEWSHNDTINYILSQFSRNFYIEENGTNCSYGFYLL